MTASRGMTTRSDCIAAPIHFADVPENVGLAIDGLAICAANSSP